MDPVQFALELFYGLSKFLLAFLMCAIALSKAGANFKKNQHVRLHHEGFWKLKYAVFLLAGLVVAAWIDAPLQDAIDRTPGASLASIIPFLLLFDAILYYVARKERMI
ncbi:MAG: hypothetical protein Q7T16_05880 [Candidatus Burarchaeum sp.]|nr:hypothetical protein [Candidatus Burarchaeum sp.]MDO8340156.1 hypothetical protein [Candidatus Burarchaeum sp.]